MPTENSSVLKNFYFWIAFSWTSIIAFLCLESANNLPKIAIHNFDKLVHASFHFVLTFLWFLYFRNKKFQDKVRTAIAKAFLLSFCYGIAIEIAQKLFTTTRSADVFDVLANTIGALIAVFIVFRIKKIMEKQNL